MKIAMKQSNFFAAIFFGSLLSWFGAYQALQANAGLQPWSDLPGLMMLAVLVAGLLAIGFNFVWLLVRSQRGVQVEEPMAYWPETPVQVKAVAVLATATFGGLLQGIALS